MTATQPLDGVDRELDPALVPAAPLDRGSRRPRRIAGPRSWGLGPWHWIGLAMLTVVVGYSLLYPLLPSYDPYGQDLGRILLTPGADPAHLFGTDSLGRDTASRLALAGRVTVGVVVVIIVVNALIGMIVGTVAGYFGGRLDNAMMALADVKLALPMILVLTALAATFGPSIKLMVIVLAVTYWVGYARVARTSATSLRQRDFVLAPALQGARTARILRVHVLPTVFSQMLILASTDVGAVILLMSSFDYLGLGVQPPVPSWGSMIGESQKYLRQNPAQAIVPGVAIFLAVAGMNLVSQRFTSERAAARRPSRRARGRKE
ncbi:ABC transporter permease [Serinibacter arcticus]|uniref:Dipeptide transport system permease protein DppC n=1 Tax=Serinibacter arcticus TaxID=1655435 RepID=A0A4Z1E5B2_9MICO|nr:ABC transporter permease [Serinibacter arcticus]TGO06379.1 Dipeptide transport system permease protein DppC [Serinibacter arcticus]